MKLSHRTWLVGVLMLTGCSKEPESPVVAPTPKPALQRELAALRDPTLKMARAVTSGKPGASVDLKYDMNNKPEASVPTEVQLALIPSAPADRLTYKITGMEGLTLAGSLEGTIDRPESGKAYEHAFSLLPQRTGIFYATVTVMTESAGSHMGRTFSVPLLVGTVSAEQKAKPAPAKDPKGQPIESMKAEER